MLAQRFMIYIQCTISAVWGIGQSIVHCYCTHLSYSLQHFLAESSLRYSKNEVWGSFNLSLCTCNIIWVYCSVFLPQSLTCVPTLSLPLSLYSCHLLCSHPLQLLQSALSVHPDKVEKTIDDIMALKKINPDTNPQWDSALHITFLFLCCG